jgi:serine protease Do
MISAPPFARSAALAVELQHLAERTRRGVVQVNDGRGGGSGTIWSLDGVIVTNHHVVPRQRARVRTPDGTEYEARVIESLPDRDIAVLKIDATELPALPAGDASALRPGELVLAVGHPFGIAGAVSLGVFSGIGPIEQRHGRHFREAIIANIELRPGNSGGPLVTADGAVVGINAMVLGHGTALAVPSAVITRLLSGARTRQLGVRIGMIATPPDLATRIALPLSMVAIVLEVIGDGLAARSGLLPGDILLRVDGHVIEEPGDIAWALSDLGDRSALDLQIVRAGRLQGITIRPLT